MTRIVTTLTWSDYAQLRFVLDEAERSHDALRNGCPPDEVARHEALVRAGFGAALVLAQLERDHPAPVKP